MAIIRWNPWNLDRILDDDLDLPAIPGLGRLVGQGLNVYETDTAIVAEAALPGIPEDKIDVTIDEGIVRITGSKEESQENKRNMMNYLSSAYNYSFRLPRGVIAEDKEPVCELENGILKLEFPKVEKTPPKKVKIVKKGK